MANNIEEVASFQLDTSKAAQQIKDYVAQLEKLQNELNDLEKEGKDTSRVMSQIEATTKKAGAAMAQYSAQTDKAAQNTQKTGKVVDNSTAAYARAATRVRSLGGALGAATAGLANIAGVANLSGFAIGAFATIGDKLVKVLTDFLFPADQVLELTKELSAAFVSESVAATQAFDAVNNATIGTEERASAIAALNEQYNQYLPNLLTEKSTNEEVAAAYDLVNESILQNILLKAKAEQQEKALKALFDLRIEAATAKTKGASDLINNAFQIAINEAEKNLQNLDFVFLEVEKNLRNTGQSFSGVSKTTQDELNKSKKALNDLNAAYKQGFVTEEAYKIGVDELSAKIANLNKVSDAQAKAQKRIAESQEKSKTKTKEQKAEYKILEGSLADLEQKLNRVNQLINEQAQIGDSATLQALSDEYNKLKTQVEAARKEIERFKNGEKLEVIDIETIDLQARSIANLKSDLENLAITNLQALTKIEQQRNAALKGVQGNREQEEAINAQFDAIRLQAEQEQTQAILRLKLRILEATKEKTAENLQEIEQIKLQLTELDKPISINTGQAEKKLTNLKEKVFQIADGVANITEQLLQFAQQSTQAVINQYDKAIAKQEDVLNRLLENQDNANVQQVALEQKRLEALQAEREKAKNREAILIQAQIAANAALTIARAAAEGGGIGSAITIAAAIASLAIGFAQAKIQAEQAFFDGTTYVQRGKNPAGRDTIPARLNEGEAVIPTATNAKYKNAVESIYHQNIPADFMNSLSSAYGNGVLNIAKLKGLRGVSGMGANALLLQGNSSRLDDSRILGGLAAIQSAINTKSTLNITERGLTYTVSKGQEKTQKNNKKYK